jgi:hypothetical protein
MRRPRYFLNSILGVVIAAGACTEAPSTGPSAAQVRVLPPLSAFQVATHPAGTTASGDVVSSPYVSCRPLKKDKKDKDFDAKGGSLDIGPHTLVVPAGALSKKIKITAEITGDSLNTIKLSPEGLQFQSSAYLFLSYANCDPPFSTQLEVVYTSDDLSAILQQLASFDSKTDKTVVGLLSHFSQYAVAY